MIIKSQGHARAYDPDIFISMVREAVVEKDRGTCGICHTAVKPDQRAFEFVVPLWKGGVMAIKNISLVHSRCISRSNKVSEAGS